MIGGEAVPLLKSQGGGMETILGHRLLRKDLLPLSRHGPSGVSTDSDEIETP